MKKTMKLMFALLVSASVSGHLHASQWSEVDTLIVESQEVVDILDEGYRRIAGAGALVGTSIVGDDMLTGTFSYSNFGVIDYRQTLMDSSTLADYNNAMLAVENSTYSMSVQEYLNGQYVKSQEEFDAAIDTYVAAASIFAKAVKVNELAAAASASDNIQDARALQDYITNNNLGITSIMQDQYNTSIVDVEDAVQLYSAVAILKEDSTTVASIQSDADAASRDYIYADDAIYDGQAKTLAWGFTGPSGQTQYAMTRSVDMSAYVTNNLSTIRGEGNTDDFYNDGPTQNSCFFATAAELADPSNACYNGG
jgi:hypothetical protein